MVPTTYPTQKLFACLPFSSRTPLVKLQLDDSRPSFQALGKQHPDIANHCASSFGKELLPTTKEG